MTNVKYISGYHKKTLTKGKVYDVIDTKQTGNIISVLVLNDLNIKRWYITTGYITGKTLFEDVTAEYRNNTINEILC